MNSIGLSWSDFKSFFSSRNIVPQYLEVNNCYYLLAFDGPFSVSCNIAMDGSDSTNQTDFESNYKSSANQPLLPVVTNVTTQFEYNNKDTKVCCAAAEVDSSCTATAELLCPGTFGSGDGRYIAGGYGISEDYNKDDRAIVWVEDTDRKIAWAIALAMNPSATAPVADATIQGMGVLPSPFTQAFPLYPILKTYYDEDAPTANQGWYFWPLAQADSLTPVGEIEVEPIAGYGFIPSGFYLKVQYIRPSGVTTGGIRLNLEWGKVNPYAIP